MITNSIAILAGLIVSIFLGLLCGPFVKFSVNIEIPPEYKFLDPQSPEYRSGGFWLGLMECALFFASFWLGDYIIAGAWLTFKVAAKWAAWQHVIQMPTRISTDDQTDFELRNKVGSLQLGRFLNGTLYNGFCGMIGFIVSKAVLTYMMYP